MLAHPSRGMLVVSLLGATPVAALAGGGGGWVEFVDETATRLVADADVGISDTQEKDYAWGDVDKDGDIDIVCVRKEPFTTPGRFRNVLFMHEGTAEGHDIDGVFVDRTQALASDADDGGQGFMDATNDRDVILIDVNGDTWLDIVTATTLSDGLPKTISHPRIYINKQDIAGVWQGFRYEQNRIPQLRTIPGNLAVAPRFCSVAGGDVTGDGFADLYFGDYDSGGLGNNFPEDPLHDVNDRLLVNDGTGVFVDSNESRMSSTMLLSAFSMAAAIADMNGDGVLDVVKDTALSFPQRISISYNDVANEGFFDDFDVVYDDAPYHISVDDLNQDDRLDIVITDDGQDTYLLNTGNGGDGLANFTLFAFVRAQGGDNQFGGNSVIADLNNDGFKDVVICDVDVDELGCARGMHYYRNLGNLPNVTMQEQGANPPWGPDGTHDIAVLDINGDGWLDLFIGTCDGTEIWINRPPADLVYTYPDGLPATAVPGVETTFRVSVSGQGTVPIPDTGKQFVSINGGPFVQSDMVQQSPNVYFAVLPPTSCPSQIRFYFSVEAEGNQTITDPRGAPGDTYLAIASFGSKTLIDERFENAVPQWTVQNNNLTTGAWERVDPVGTDFPEGSGQPAQPEDDFGAAAEETHCFITQQHPGFGGTGQADVDGGPTTLFSPAFDLDGTDAVISYARWHFCNDEGTANEDALITEINNGSGWVHVSTTLGTNREWEAVSFQVSEFVSPSATMQVRFRVADSPNNSITESGIDNFKVVSLVCGESCNDGTECQDGLFCNGVEQCIDNACVPGPDPCPNACDEDNDMCVDCLIDADCDDGAFCTGVETCVDNVCVAGQDPCVDLGMTCDEQNDECIGCLGDEDCDDGVFCNGVETCVGQECMPGTPPCAGDQVCDEDGQVCVDCLTDPDCDDGIFCNGAEQCVAATCQAGDDPCPDPDDICDEQGDQCTECVLDADCEDGLYCNGAESCVDGSCVHSGTPCPGDLCDEREDVCHAALQPRFGEPVLGLTTEQADAFAAGQAKFVEVLSLEGGLGPVFNQISCVACHNVSGAGGPGTQLVTRFGFAAKGAFDPLAQFGGSLLQANSIDPGNCDEVVPPEANVTAQRITPQTFGAGLVEAIPDDVLIALAASQVPPISGRVHMVEAVEDGPGAPLHVGRFGWKAQVATVLTFSGDASLNEMGLTNRLFPDENDPNGIRPPELADCDDQPDPEDGPDGEGLHFIDRVTDFQRFLAPPPQTPRSGMPGEALFNLIGCGACHVATFTTGTVEESALSSQVIKPYSDFLLHDMGSLGDGIAQGDAQITEMRTAPLWGLRIRNAMLHDGRVIGGPFRTRIDAVINWHAANDSEAAASATQYANLSEEGKTKVVAFLNSLGRVEFDGDGDNDVDLSDLEFLTDCLNGAADSPYTASDPCAICDVDQDGNVDLLDYRWFMQAFGGKI